MNHVLEIETAKWLLCGLINESTTEATVALWDRSLVELWRDIPDADVQDITAISHRETAIENYLNSIWHEYWESDDPENIASLWRVLVGPAEAEVEHTPSPRLSVDLHSLLAAQSRIANALKLSHMLEMSR